MREIILLGPQAFQPNLDRALAMLDLEDPICVVTAGWQERAGELEALEAHIGRKVFDLTLYQRAEQLIEKDPELFAAHRRRQNRLRGLQDLYRTRLSYTLEAARHLLHIEGDSDLLGPERRDAVEAIRQLDRRHLERLREINAEYDELWRPSQRTSVARHRREIAAIVSQCSSVLVAGGHVAVLLNRLRLFDIKAMLEEKPVVAWSGGAMALSEQLVLFHDSPPQGPGNAEVLEEGLGIFQGILPLPHARRRLRLDDPVRVALFASRFSPALCVAMDQGSLLHWNGQRWNAGPGTRRLTSEGILLEVGGE